MTTPSYRLDTICGNLIERLEGARRTWRTDPEGAAAGLERIAAEQLNRILDDYEDIYDGPAWPNTVRREVLQTFLPRYVRLAIDHNRLEERGYDAWRSGDPIARVVGGLVALGAAGLVVRVVHRPAALIAFAVAMAVPFIPEIRRFHYRRRYGQLLQEVVDDMGRIQDELDRYPAVRGAKQAPLSLAPDLPAGDADSRVPTTSASSAGPRATQGPVLVPPPSGADGAPLDDDPPDDDPSRPRPRPQPERKP